MAANLQNSCILLLALIVHASDAFHTISPQQFFSEKYERFLQQTSRFPTQFSSSPNGTKMSGRVFYPTGYGADPTGAEDSSNAIMLCVNDAFSVQKGLELMNGINDLGGVIVDLQGGNYKIGSPLRFPSGGNVLMRGGTLRASSDFKPEDYLMELSADLSASPKPRLSKTTVIQATDFDEIKLARASFFFEDITFRDILFDSNYKGGGLFIIDAVRTRIDNCFFLHFSTEGILVERGHETFISSSFLGQHPTAGGDPNEKKFTGTAVDLASNDNVITDVAIFSAEVGVLLRGQANILTGVHCYNKAKFWGGVGVHVKLAGLAQTRIDNCYMDYTGIVMEDPVQVHVTNGFFLGNANIILKSVKGRISGLNIVDNMFSGSGSSTAIVELDEGKGPFTRVDQVVIERNNVDGMVLKSTLGKMTVGGVAKRWVANFSSELVFPNRINHIGYSFYTRDGRSIVGHAVVGVSGNVVTVGTKTTVDAVVSFLVDQNSKVGEKSLFG